MDVDQAIGLGRLEGVGESQNVENVSVRCVRRMVVRSLTTNIGVGTDRREQPAVGDDEVRRSSDSECHVIWCLYRVSLTRVTSDSVPSSSCSRLSILENLEAISMRIIMLQIRSYSDQFEPSYPHQKAPKSTLLSKNKHQRRLQAYA